MKKVLLLALLVLVIGIFMNDKVQSSSSNVTFSYQTSGGGTSTSTTSSTTSGAAASSVVYVIVDGPGAGTQLSTSVDPNTGKPTANETDNSATKANGHIGGIGVGEGMNCPGPLGHYHGTLKGAPDPDPENCGWGHVAELSSLSDGLMGISNAYTNEIAIINFIDKEPPDYDMAADAADMAAMDLSMLQDDINDPTKNMIGMGAVRRVNDQLDKAIKGDKFVVMTLNPLPTKRDAGKDAAINLKINNALMAKQEALMALQDAEVMAAAMAAMGK